MKRFLLLALLATIVIIQGCKEKRSYDPEPIKVGLPDGTNKTTSRKNIMLTLDADNKIYIWNRKIETIYLDSLLKIEIDKISENDLDTVTIVINADSVTSYGMVFHVMRAAKKNRAKVVARVD